MAYIDLIIISAKAIGIVLSGFFGIYGLVNNYKINDKVTRQGKLAIFGIGFGAVLSAVAFGATELKKSSESAQREIKLLEEARHNRQVLDNLFDIANRVNFVEATIELELSFPDALFESDLAANLGQEFKLLTVRQLWECRHRAFLATQNSTAFDQTRLNGDDYLGPKCDDFRRIDSSIFYLPSIRVSFYASRGSADEIGFLRIDPEQHVTSQDITEITVRDMGNNSTVNLTYDDVPIRFRTNRLRSIGDFANVQLAVKLNTDKFSVNGFRPTIDIIRLNLDMSDGQDITIYKSQFLVEGNKTDGLFSFNFPEDRDMLRKLFEDT